MQAQYQQQAKEWQPSPYEQALNKEGLDWLNATNGETPLDISNLPGMSPYLDIYDNAVAGQQGERIGTGMMPFGSALANPALLANLAQQEESHRRQAAGAQLSDAFALRNAEVRGSALPLIGMMENRSATKLGTTANMANSAANRWAQYQVRPGFLSRLAEEATRGAAAAAASRI